jgi:YD repeat-containing protein
LRRESYTDEKQYIEGKTVEEWVYDDKGRLVRSFTYNSLDPSSKLYTESLVDEPGRTIAELDATGRHKTTFAYDAFGTLVSETYPNGATLAYAAAPDGRASAITQSTREGESSENTTLYTAGEVTRIVSGDCAVGYRYDSKRRLIEVDLNDTFHVGWVRMERVNEAGEKEYTTETYYANGEKTRTVRDSHGNVKSKELGYDTAEEMTTVYTAEYETDGRPKCVKNAEGDTIQSFSYDEKHRLVSTLAGAEQYGYDTSDRLVSRTVTVGEDTQAYTYTYDTVTGRLTKTTVDGISVTPKYDLLGRNAGKTVEVSANKTIAENISYLKVGDHATALPCSVQYKNGGIMADKLSYVYDVMGNICEVKENGAVVARYAYDGFGRLLREDNKPMGKTTVFSYDANGNILSKRAYIFTLKSMDGLEEMPCDEKLYAYKGDRLTSYNGEEFVYDEIGNPTTYRGRSVVWSYGRLSSMDGNTFSYDVLGRRVGKNDIAFTYDGNGNLIRQSNGLEFLYDHTGVFAVKHNNTTYFYRKDAQANIVALLDNTGAVVVKYKYDAWGNQTLS